MRLKGANVSSQSLRPSPCWYQAAIPCGSMPKGMEENQAVAGSRSTQYVPGGHERFDLTLGGRVEAGEGRHDLAAGIDLHRESSAAHLADEVPQLLG